jgi:hypothetical protein
MTTDRFKSLKDRPRHELADMVRMMTEEVERLEKELTLERNTNVHLKASIRERAEL